MAALLLLVVACDGDSDDPEPTVTASPTATATQTTTPAATASPKAEEPQDPLRSPASATGIFGVDSVIAAVLGFDGDYAELDALVGYTDLGCTLKLGGGGPPKCWGVPGAAQVEGTEVSVFAFSVCEGEWEPRSDSLDRVLGRLVDPIDLEDATLEVYGVYRVAPVAEPSPWPTGQHAVVFATRGGETPRGTVVRIAGGEIVSMEFGCGTIAPAIFAAGFFNSLLEPPLAGLGLDGESVIDSVERLPGFAVEETVPRWQAVLHLAASVGGYRSVLIDSETDLIDSEGTPVDLEELTPGTKVSVSGVPLPWSLWRAERVVVMN